MITVGYTLPLKREQGRRFILINNAANINWKILINISKATGEEEFEVI